DELFKKFIVEGNDNNDDEDDDEATYNDREYDVEDDDGDEEDLNEVTEIPAGSGAGYAAANHSLDSTPKTADGDIDPKFVFCVALFLVGLAGLIFARRRSLIHGVNRDAEENDELD
ncbi:MAG: hypothetical protein IJ682_05450, partial [Lachnospiraceae bacterium]|nr:hypothetical protein [Lachnospiraceae bacterium]